MLVCEEVGTVFADPRSIARADQDLTRSDPFDTCPVCERVPTVEFRPANSDEIRALGFQPGEYV
jgi:hypothetical protein